MFRWLMERMDERKRIRRMMRGLRIGRVRRGAYHNPTVMRWLPGGRWAA